MNYIKKCSECNKETKHRVVNISLKQGVKLQCLCCGKFLKRYIKIKFLEEAKE